MREAKLTGAITHMELGKLEALLKLLNENNVTVYKDNEITLQLVPSGKQQSFQQPTVETDEDLLFYSSGE